VVLDAPACPLLALAGLPLAHLLGARSRCMGEVTARCSSAMPETPPLLVCFLNTCSRHNTLFDGLRTAACLLRFIFSHPKSSTDLRISLDLRDIVPLLCFLSSDQYASAIGNLFSIYSVVRYEALLSRPLAHHLDSVTSLTE
jgi:hypothetical protein